MCTILTIDRPFYIKNTKLVLAQIKSDALSNPDGFSLLGLDPEDETMNLNFKTMNAYMILSMVENFFENASMNSRIWLHCRMATTHYVGISFNHGFDDEHGTVIMHNGILRNDVQALTVDSFKLKKYDWSNPDTVLAGLKKEKEDYANIFAIDTQSYIYSVLRLSVGTLYTDFEGNYSSRPFGDICIEVDRYCVETHYMPMSEETIYDIREETDDDWSRDDIRELGWRADELSDYQDYMRAMELDELWPSRRKA